ncbi:MAG: D-sedoheptulose 7-phosphate isomerase [Candidatus Pacebacteria bacterium]|nr:D-sedoheptulose 7-phosphate isomerase [Candidatus Paceibacterota bacterium]
MKNYIQESIEVKNKILNSEEILNQLNLIIAEINNCFQRGNKVLIAGNGGSAADAQHFVGEIVGRYKKERKGYPAIALSTDSSVLTAWANDYGFETVFSRQVEALGKQGDIFFGISTSGNSKNIIEAVKKSKELGLTTICLAGKDGGKLKDLADFFIVVPSDNTPRIQESHIMLIHIICEEVEKNFR